MENRALVSLVLLQNGYTILKNAYTRKLNTFSFMLPLCQFWFASHVLILHDFFLSLVPYQISLNMSIHPPPGLVDEPGELV